MQVIDVVFATYNGARTLPAMLEAFAALRPTRRRLRILAIDNGSTDGTHGLLTNWSDRLPLHILDGPGTGKVPALASAVVHLEGELVVLTDDDIIPHADWLAELEAAADASPDASIFGGTITPVPIDQTGPWYEASVDHVADLFSGTNAPAGPVKGSDTIFGPNLMMRRDAAAKGLSYPTQLGPSRATRNGKRVFPIGDESEMIARLEKAGHRSVFVPSAHVAHMVRDFQTTLPFMLQRAQNHGRGVALRRLGPAPSLSARAGMAADALLRAAWIWPRAALVNRSLPDRARFNTLYGLNWHTGRAKGALNGPFVERSGARSAR